MENNLMTRKIRIFVAGSKGLKPKRDFVKKIVMDYNTNHFDMYMKPYIFYIYDYESFYPAQRRIGQQEELYNTFIDSHADLALFFIEGNLGEKTKEELNVALNAIKKDRRPLHPDVHVFGRKGLNSRDIEDIVKDYFKDYTSYDNLEKSIISILDGFVDRLEMYRNSFSEDYYRNASEREMRFMSYIYSINYLSI